MKILAFANHKGGVGKTTSCINVGAGLARLGKKVLLVDLDPQTHLTTGLGVDATTLEQDMMDVFSGRSSLAQAIITRGQVALAPASTALADADMLFSSRVGREYMLKDILAGAGEYDYVILDCPPSLGFLTLNAFTAADDVYVPLQTQFFALHGLSHLMEIVRIVRSRLNPKLRLGGIIATMYNAKANLNREVVEMIRENFPAAAFTTVIRQNIALAEAPSHGMTIFEYNPSSNGAKDYHSLVRELVGREEGVVNE